MPQLGHLVEAAAAEEPAQPGDPGVSGRRHLGAGLADPHAAQLGEPERSAALADPHLPVENRPAVVEDEQHRHDQQDRCEEHQHRRRDQDVEGAAGRAHPEHGPRLGVALEARWGTARAASTLYVGASSVLIALRPPVQGRWVSVGVGAGGYAGQPVPAATKIPSNTLATRSSSRLRCSRDASISDGVMWVISDIPAW